MERRNKCVPGFALCFIVLSLLLLNEPINLISPVLAEENWKETSMYCVCVAKSCRERYYGIHFYRGKAKTLHIHQQVLEVPQDSSGHQYSLATIFAAKKIFWKGVLGVNSLDRKNFLHLLNGKEYGWCKPYSILSVTRKLQDKIETGQRENSTRTISDKLE